MAEKGHNYFFGGWPEAPWKREKLDMVKYIDQECGEIAFFKTGIPWSFGDPIYASDVVLLDGTTPDQFSPIVCGSCGRHLNILELRYEPTRGD